MEISTNYANSIKVVLLVCAKVAFHIQRLQIDLTEINDGQERRRRGAGRRRRRNEVQDRHVCLMATRDRFSSSRQLGNNG